MRKANPCLLARYCCNPINKCGRRADKRRVQLCPSVSGRARELVELWLEGGPPSQVDLRVADSLAARLAKFEGLRPFSDVVQKLVAYLANPDFRTEKVRKLVESDPGLAVRIMRLANSSVFRGYQPCTSVGNAITRIGASNLGGMAMAMSAMSLFRDLDGQGQKVREHCVGTAVVARELALNFGWAAHSSQMFLIGLLHDIGKLLLLQTGDRSYAALLDEDPVPARHHLGEQMLLGFDHGVLGGHVLRSWNLPEPIPQAVACHHRPKSGMNELAPLTKILNLLRVADVVDWCLGQGCTALSSQVCRISESPDGVRLGLDHSTLPSLWDHLCALRLAALQAFR
jgi:putative nucleotidyltransferase with HDIG domain